MWPFSTAKKDAQSASINAAEIDMAEARLRFAEALCQVRDAHDEDVRAMLRGLLPDHKVKADRK